MDDVATLVAEAREKERLDDLGPGAFEEPLGILLDSYAAAGLNEVGTFILRQGVVHSLRMRLRAQEWVRRHPEIADEVIESPVVVVGMMRSGTTLVQRLLAADERLHCAYGWEVQQVAPRLDWDPTREDPRIGRALAREEQTRQHAPDLFAIHPMYAREAEEEIVFLADAFLSHVPESGADVAAYREWLDTADFAPAYDHLHRMLQLLQWQKKQRGETGERWVLKTPAHLGYLGDLRRTFPDLHVVHLHRDPLETIPSGASLNSTLHAMHADTVDTHRIGREWLARMGWTNDRAMATRERWEAGTVTDLQFEEAVADPIGSMATVYDATGMTLSADAERAMRAWLERRPREAGRPDYTPATYGLDEAMIRERFADYERRFRH